MNLVNLSGFAGENEFSEIDDSSFFSSWTRETKKWEGKLVGKFVSI